LVSEIAKERFCLLVKLSAQNDELLLRLALGF